MVVEEPQEPDIPVTILTGFLGAGKNDSFESYFVREPQVQNCGH